MSTSQTETALKKLVIQPDMFDVQRYRALVPSVDKNDVRYLDASYQPPMNLKIRQAIDSFLDAAVYEANPKPNWQASIEGTRALVARYLEAPTPASIAFTSDTTEGLNLFQRSLKFGAGDNVVILDTEHPNHAYGWLALRATRLEVRQVNTHGKLFADASTFAPMVDENTKAIGISSIVFHSGQKNNVKDICDRYRPLGVQVLVEMTQEVDVGPVSVKDTGVSAACFSFHKALGCPTGLGALYVDPTILDELKLDPPIVGAGSIANLAPTLLASSGLTEYHHSTRRFEHLNLSFISIKAAHAALEFLLNDMTPEGVERHLRSLGSKLQEECDKLGIEIIGEREPSKHSPHCYVLNLICLEAAL
ncbi:hypothetical protein KCU77_g4501, partial [Aureobasidium melanogenum]